MISLILIRPAALKRSLITWPHQNDCNASHWDSIKPICARAGISDATIVCLPSCQKHFISATGHMYGCALTALVESEPMSQCLAVRRVMQNTRLSDDATIHCSRRWRPGGDSGAESARSPHIQTPTANAHRVGWRSQLGFFSIKVTT